MFEASPNLITDKVNISKQYIEKYLSQAEIMKYYLGGFPVEEWIDTRINFCSELRKDNSPTCSLYTKNGNLYYKDWNGHFHGDCYNLVCFKNNLQYNDLMGAMKIIVRDFAHVFFGGGEAQDAYLRTVIDDANKEEKRQKQIQIKKQLWRPEQIAYWQSYHITSSVLAHYWVYSPEYIWLEGKMYYMYQKQDFAIAYYFGNGRWKIYYPMRTKGNNRFMGNSSAIQGYNQLPEKGDLLIWTKSLKDVMVLYMLGYNAVALQSEQHDLPQDAMEHLSSRFKKHVVFYDNDEAGRNGATKICDKYDLTYIEVPESYVFCKDISDVAKEHGLEEAENVMEELLEYIL